MNVAESTVDREEVFHKGWGAEVFRKICPHPSLWEDFKVTAPTRLVIDN